VNGGNGGRDIFKTSDCLSGDCIAAKG
jgi:hypothetical protein